MKFLKDKQGKDVIIIGILAFMAYKFMGVFGGAGFNKPKQKVTV